MIGIVLEFCAIWRQLHRRLTIWYKFTIRSPKGKKRNTEVHFGPDTNVVRITNLAIDALPTKENRRENLEKEACISLCNVATIHDTVCKTSRSHRRTMHLNYPPVPIPSHNVQAMMLKRQREYKKGIARHHSRQFQNQEIISSDYL
jgi:hypothetical protein